MAEGKQLKKRLIIPKHIKLAVIMRDKCICQYCGKEGIYTDHYGPRVIDKERKIESNFDGTHKWEKEIAFEFDHIIPLSKGGKTIIDNIVLSCRKCNRTKGDKLNA